jgi:hypothetical protein
MLKKIAIVGVLGVATLALGALMAEGARGKGVARSAENQPARFRFDVRKVTDGTRVHLGGAFNFESGNPAVPASRFQVQSNVVRIQVNQAATVSSFGGHGHKSFLHNGQVVHIPGMVRVHVFDGRTQANPDGVDRIEVEFVPRNPAHASTAFQYNGNVVEGDIIVFRRTE